MVKICVLVLVQGRTEVVHFEARFGVKFQEVCHYLADGWRALDPQSVNAILKQRARMAGLDSGEFSAHGLRSGYLTEAANRGISLPEAEQSLHWSVQQASSYYNSAVRRTGRAAQLLP